MIISRSPLRVSLGGGGSDLPSYYASYGGFLIAGAIDKYVYVLIHSRFVDGFLLKYSQMAETSSIDEIRHPIIREALRLVDIPREIWKSRAWRTFLPVLDSDRLAALQQRF
jgi:D-glycero-alpha-D-manno-heptose-7-phosphate kinase